MVALPKMPGQLDESSPHGRTANSRVTVGVTRLPDVSREVNYRSALFEIGCGCSAGSMDDPA
jgi:hypothetical protein